MIGTRSRQAQNLVRGDAFGGGSGNRIGVRLHLGGGGVGSISCSTATPARPIALPPDQPARALRNPWHIRVYAIEGMAATPSIHRQAFSPTPASIAFDAKAIENPEHDVELEHAGEAAAVHRRRNSEISQGAATVETPMPIPPITRAAMVMLASPVANAHPNGRDDVEDAECQRCLPAAETIGRPRTATANEIVPYSADAMANRRHTRGEPPRSVPGSFLFGARNHDRVEAEPNAASADVTARSTMRRLNIHAPLFFHYALSIFRLSSCL